ncbi:MAG: DUF1223 domain-containing protein [Acidobacteriota bacterium]|nr:DUF1223 domain-containing protein [Acidobacteriota bacterium]
MKPFTLLTAAFLMARLTSSANDSANQKTVARIPVLLELFTSEGCSSCPPADKLLAQLDRDQPIAGADLIVLSEHVDYWNHLGWADPYSSPAFSRRQRDYAARLPGGGVYTPELVVDGSTGFVGSDRGNAGSAIRDAIRAQKLPVTVTASRDGDNADVHFDVGPSKVNATVYMVLAQDRASSQVASGENSGRNLDHVAVVYSFKKVGVVGESGLQNDVQVQLKKVPTRVVLFVQAAGTLHVLGAAEARI